jgi:hypothetical protein
MKRECKKGRKRRKGIMNGRKRQKEMKEIMARGTERRKERERAKKAKF